MSEQHVPEPADIRGTDENRLPVPAPVRLAAPLRHDGRAVARLTARGIVPGAVRAASIAGVVAAAAMTGAAVAVRLLRPLIMEARPGLPHPNRLPITAEPLRVAVHIHYTRWEIHWPHQT